MIGGFSWTSSCRATVRNETAVCGETNWDIYGRLNLLLRFALSCTHTLSFCQIFRTFEINVCSLASAFRLLYQIFRFFLIAHEFSLPREPSCTVGTVTFRWFALHWCPSSQPFIICVWKSARFIWFTQPCMQLPIRRSTCPLRFPSFTGSIMMVYRIRVLSFFHPSLMSDHWLLFQTLTLHRIHFQKVQTSFPSSDESAPDMRQSRKPSFFSVAVLTTVKCDLFKTEVHGPQGRERRIKTGSERKHVTGVSAFSLHVFFLSNVRVISLVFLSSPNIP